jgi:hypothetical protein
MDDSLRWLNEQKVKRAIDALKRNGFNAVYAQTAETAVKFIEDAVETGSVVAVGGSATLNELNILEMLRNGEYEFLDRYAPGLTPAEVKDVQRRSFFADYYLMSSNAITEEGYLFNVDGSGNRVAALLYGPDNVIVIAGHNKIVGSEKDALDRVRRIASPPNTKRLGRKTPCAETGICSECNSPDRICKGYVTVRKNMLGRITVLIVGEELGY